VSCESDVVIVGSGPYALSLAAQLRARRVDFRIFGPPMKFWRDMPRGINLKSFAFATNIYVGAKGYTFPEWCRAQGLEDFEPCTMASFAAYGTWMKDRFVSSLEPVEVSRVSIGGGGGFEIALADEGRVRARRVVFATGLTHLAYVPDVLSGFPPELVSHTFDHSDYSRFRGKEVAILGAGASAIEAGALVHENGGSARILVREDEALFSDKLGAKRSLYHRLRYPNSVIGPGMKSRIMQTIPLAVHFIPERQRIRLVKNHLGPAAPWWIKDRVIGHVPILVKTAVAGAERMGNRVRLRVREAGQSERTLEVDHVIAGTGYVPDVDRLTYLDDDLRRRLRRVERGPALSMNFESSVRGAYFIGPVAALSFGPLFRFVAGAEYAAPALARHLAGPVRRMTTAVRRWSRKDDYSHEAGAMMK
jgi:thioredoxin reductase